MSDPIEEWRPVVGWEGLYEVSDQGRVRSLDRHLTVRSRWGQMMPQTYRGQLMTISDAHAGGYCTVKLTRDGKGSMHYVHRLVLEAFVGPRPDGMEACHNSGDPADNRPGNLRWDTTTGNMADKVRHGTNGEGPRKTRCVRGHEYTEATTYVDPAGRRSCKPCMNLRARERRAARGLHDYSLCQAQLHEWTPENTITDKHGDRRCRECRMASASRRRR